MTDKNEYYLTISSYKPKYDGQKVKVDENIYNLLKDEKIYYAETCGNRYIKVYMGERESSRDINSYIVEYKRYKTKVDYKNENFFDRTRENIVLVDNYRNAFRDSRKIKGVKFKGVTYNRETRKFVSYMQYFGRPLYITCHTDDEHLARIYDAAMVTFFKDRNPILNFPDKVDLALLSAKDKERIIKNMSSSN